MNKKELIAAVAAKTGCTQKVAGEVIDAFLVEIAGALHDEGKAQIFGFGNFEKKVRPERKGRNPRTGEEMTIQASNSVAFKAAKALKDAL